jgi:hypothetical protein
MGKAKAKGKPKLMKVKMKIAGRKAKKNAKKIGIPALIALAAGGAAFKMKKSGGRWRPFKLVPGGAGDNGKPPLARPATPAEGAKAPMGTAGGEPKASETRAEPAAPKK